MREETAKLAHWQNCPACGHHNGAWENRCEKCGRRLSAKRGGGRGSVGGTSASDSPNTARPDVCTGESEHHRKSQKIAPRPAAFPEHLRRQLQERVVRYRTRQDNPTLALPFEEEPEPAPKILAFPAPPVPVEEEVRVSRSGPLRENRGSEGAATPAPAPQPILEFQSGALQEQAWRIRPVAPLRLRVSGHLKDMQIIAGAAILFLAAMAVIPYFGVTVHPNLILLSGMVCGSLLLTLLFGLLFVWGAGVTPGMKSAGLRLVNFDGMPASRWQRLWRVLGAIVSAGSFFIGYLWAVVDEETLYWHDHISKTYLTRSDP